jgi:polysaccharide export outer membrane protein
MESGTMKNVFAGLCVLGLLAGCTATTGGNGAVTQVVPVEQVSSGVGQEELEQIAQFKEAREEVAPDPQLEQVVQGAIGLSADEYISRYGQGAADEEYSIGGNDVLSITVYEEPDLSRESIRVTRDGSLNFPLIGKLEVGGRTTAQVERLIADEFTRQQYLIDPHVSVMVKEYLSKKVLVLGSVETPGTYPLQRAERLLDVISKAGGVDFAEGANRINVVRVHDNGGGEQKYVIDINLRRLLDGQDQTANLLLEDGDVINIPKAEKIFLIGQIQEPGDYVLKDRDLSIVEAIGMAGGFTRIAAQNRVKIIRDEQGRETVIEVDVEEITDTGNKGGDVQLKPNDIIVVPESFF